MTSEEIELQKLQEIGPFKARPLSKSLLSNKYEKAESVRSHPIEFKEFNLHT